LSNTATAVARFGDRRGAEHLAVLVNPNDPALGRDRVHDPDVVLVEQRIELVAERAETPVCTSTNSPSARTRSTTNRPTGTSRRSPGSANSAFTAA
jgi:hypothetical protein